MILLQNMIILLIKKYSFKLTDLHKTEQNFEILVILRYK